MVGWTFSKASWLPNMNTSDEDAATGGGGGGGVGSWGGAKGAVDGEVVTVRSCSGGDGTHSEIKCVFPPRRSSSVGVNDAVSSDSETSMASRAFRQSLCTDSYTPAHFFSTIKKTLWETKIGRTYQVGTRSS